MYAEVIGYLLGLYVYCYWLRDKLYHTRYKDFSNVRESRSARAKRLADPLPAPRERILEPLPNVPVFIPKTEIKTPPSISASSTSKSTTGKKKKDKRKKVKSGASPKPTIDELEMGLENRPLEPVDSEEKDVITACELSTTADKNKPMEKKSTANVPEAGVFTAKLIDVDSKTADENLKATKSPACSQASSLMIPGSVPTKSTGSIFDPTQPTVTPITAGDTSKNTTESGESGEAAKKKSKKKKKKKKKDKKKSKSSDGGLKSTNAVPSTEGRVEMVLSGDEQKKKTKDGAAASGGGQASKKKNRNKSKPS